MSIFHSNCKTFLSQIVSYSFRTQSSRIWIHSEDAEGGVQAKGCLPCGLPCIISHLGKPIYEQFDRDAQNTRWINQGVFPRPLKAGSIPCDSCALHCADSKVLGPGPLVKKSPSDFASDFLNAGFAYCLAWNLNLSDLRYLLNVCGKVNICFFILSWSQGGISTTFEDLRL